MSASTVVTRGFGSFGSVNLVVTRGYGGAAVVEEDEGEAAPPVMSGGDWKQQWLPVKPKPKKRKPQPHRGTAAVSFSSTSIAKGHTAKGAAWQDEDDIGAVSLM